MTLESHEKPEVLMKRDSSLLVGLNDQDTKSFFDNQRKVDSSLTVSADNQTLVFDTKSLYGDSANHLALSSGKGPGDRGTATTPFIASAADFDRLNVNKSMDPKNDVVTRSELTQGILHELIQCNTNGNDRVDRDEWLKISGKFGYDDKTANHLYDLGTRLDKKGYSLSEIADRLITKDYMAADLNNTGSLDRNEFSSLLPKDNPQQPPNKGTDQPIYVPNDNTNPQPTPSDTRVTDGSDIYNQLRIDSGVSQADITQVKSALKNVPEPVRQALRDLKPEIIITPNVPVKGAAAYWDAANNQIVIGAGSGMVQEAASHEFWHVADTRYGITDEPGFKQAAATDLQNGALNKIGGLKSILVDDPIVNGTPVGDVFAEVGVDIDRYYGGNDDQTGIASAMGRGFSNTENWLRQWTQAHMA